MSSIKLLKLNWTPESIPTAWVLSIFGVEKNLLVFFVIEQNVKWTKKDTFGTERILVILEPIG